MAITGVAIRQARIGTGDTISGSNTYEGVRTILINDVAPVGITTNFEVIFDRTKVQMIAFATDQYVTITLNGTNISSLPVNAGDMFLWTKDVDTELTGDCVSLSVVVPLTPTSTAANISIKVIEGA